MIKLMTNRIILMGAWVLIIPFFLLIYYSKLSARLTKLYYDVAGIPYWTMYDKFHPYYVRKDNK